jgi:BirA family biotin operon repressor/biotin-[acetyl-CoA-carboxylase] ligase
MGKLPDDLALHDVQRDLPAQTIGSELVRYSRVGSTNDLMKERAQAGAEEGLVILAEEQTAGRGRMGRAWIAPPGSSLLLSVLLRPALPADESFVPMMLAGVALCEAVEQVALVRAALKWPNDLLLPLGAGDTPELRKAAGVLCDLSLEAGQVAWVAVGIGINVGWSPQDVVDGRNLSQTATSVAAAAGREVSRLALLRALLTRLDARYQEVRRGRQAELFGAWRARLATLGRQVEIRMVDEVLRGVAEDVEPSGALVLRDADGVRRVVTAGDVER